ncbi:kelch-like protein 24 [Branchiostoma floridae x Branchiostoma japonicum]
MATTSQRPKASLDFRHDSHSSALLQGLQELRSDNLLVDVILCVSGKEIPCHRNVLAACSGYFHAMFCNGHLESKGHKVTIHEARSSALQILVDYAYTSKVTITEDNAVELMEGANFFQVPPVSDACTKFLSDSLCVKNCMKMVILGGMLNPSLETEALSYAMKEFAAASKTPEFLDLTKEQLMKLISSDDLNASEETVYMSVMKWINHDTRKRREGAARATSMEELYRADLHGGPVTPHPSPPYQWSEGGSGGHWGNRRTGKWRRKPFGFQQLHHDDTLLITIKHQLGFYDQK